VSKKRKFVNDGVFQAELNEFLTRELGEDGYSGVSVRKTPCRTEIIIKATRTQNVLGEKGRRIRELTSLIKQRHNFPPPPHSVELYAARVPNRAMCAVAQAESLRYKLLGGLAVRRACYGVLRYIMENGAKGCEIIVSGKLRAQRAKSMKFKDGYMIKSGDAVIHYIDKAYRHIKMKQGVLGIKVAIMLPYDETEENGPSVMQPDLVTVLDPEDEDPPPAKGYGQQMGQPMGQSMEQQPAGQMVQQVPEQSMPQEQTQMPVEQHPQVPQDQGQMQQPQYAQQQQQYTPHPQHPQQTQGVQQTQYAPQ
jgi:ribosomal protein uS3